MAVKTIAELKALWIDGYVPTEADYVDLFDSIESFGIQEMYKETGLRGSGKVEIGDYDEQGEGKSLIIDNSDSDIPNLMRGALKILQGDIILNQGINDNIITVGNNTQENEYQLPDKSGVLAVISDLLDYATLIGDNTFTGDNSFTGENSIDELLVNSILTTSNDFFADGGIITPKVTGLIPPVDTSDAANKAYVDDNIEVVGAGNGLTKDLINSIIKLGGALSESLNLDTNTQDVKIGNYVTDEESGDLLFNTGLQIMGIAGNISLIKNGTDGFEISDTDVKIFKSNSKCIVITEDEIILDTGLTSAGGVKSVDIISDKIRIRKSNGAETYAILDFQSSGMGAGDQTFLFPAVGGRLALDGNNINNITSNSVSVDSNDFLGQYVVLTPASGTDSDLLLNSDVGDFGWGIGGSCKVLFRGTGNCTFSPFIAGVTIITPTGFTISENEVANIIKISANTYSVSK